MTAVAAPVRAFRPALQQQIAPRDSGRWLAPVVSFSLILALWQASVLVFRLPSFILRPPFEVLTALFSNVPVLLHDTRIAGRETVAGFYSSIGDDTGLGQRILAASDSQRTEQAFAVILMLTLLGNPLFTLAEKLVCPWYDEG